MVLSKGVLGGDVPPQETAWNVTFIIFLMVHGVCLVLAGNEWRKKGMATVVFYGTFFSTYLALAGASGNVHDNESGPAEDNVVAALITAIVLALFVPIAWSFEVPVSLGLARTLPFAKRFMGRTYQPGKYFGYLMGSFVAVGLALSFLFRAVAAILVVSDLWAWGSGYEHVFNALMWVILPLLTLLLPVQVYLSRKHLAGALLRGPWNFDAEEVNGATVPAPIFEKALLAFVTSYIGAYLVMYSVILTHGIISTPFEVWNEYKPLHLLDWTSYERSLNNSQNGIWYFVLGHQILALLGFFWQLLFAVILDVRHSKNTKIKPLSKRVTRLSMRLRGERGGRNNVDVESGATSTARSSLNEDYQRQVQMQLYASQSGDSDADRQTEAALSRQNTTQTIREENQRRRDEIHARTRLQVRQQAERAVTADIESGLSPVYAENPNSIARSYNNQQSNNQSNNRSNNNLSSNNSSALNSTNRTAPASNPLAAPAVIGSPRAAGAGGAGAGAPKQRGAAYLQWVAEYERQMAERRAARAQPPRPQRPQAHPASQTSGRRVPNNGMVIA